MDIIKGEGTTICWSDPDDVREWFAGKDKGLRDKVMEMREAVKTFIKPGSSLMFGGFGYVRTPVAFVHEMIRQEIKDLKLLMVPDNYIYGLLLLAGASSEVELAFTASLEVRGLLRGIRKLFETGKVKILSEWSLGSFQWRLRAAAMGIPWTPIRSLLGSDTFRKSAAMQVTDPMTGKPITMVPACWPDVAVVHVHKADKYGNAQIIGPLMADFNLVRAAKNLVIVTEELVSPEHVREEPWRTTIPHFLVDAVVVQPYGAHPTLMPTKYYWDEDHLYEFLKVTENEEGAREYIKKYIIDSKDYWDYLENKVGLKKLKMLEDIEEGFMEPEYPWVNRK